MKGINMRDQHKEKQAEITSGLIKRNGTTMYKENQHYFISTIIL